MVSNAMQPTLVLSWEEKKRRQASHKHVVKHTACERINCPICDGGLFECADCGAIEIEAEECYCSDALPRF